MTILKVFIRLVIKIKNGFIFISPAIHHFENYLSVCSFKDFIQNADSVSPLVTDAKRQRYLDVHQMHKCGSGQGKAAHICEY